MSEPARAPERAEADCELRNRGADGGLALLRRILGEHADGTVCEFHAVLTRELTRERLAAWREPSDGPVGREAFRTLGALGALGVAVPEEHGGRGLSVPGTLAVSILLALRDEGGLVLGTAVQSEVACRWLLSADPAVRDAHLPGLLSGESLACQCDTDASADEPTTAELDGDGILLRGRKLYVINGAQADLCFVAARIGSSPAIVLVEKSRPGVRVEHHWDKLGVRSVDSATIALDRVRVPRSHLLSRHGLHQMLFWNEVMSRLRLSIAAAATALQDDVLEHIVAHVRKRQLGGRPLGAWPVNHHALARARADRELMIAGLSACVERGKRLQDSVPQVAQLKWFCVERACALAQLACDLEGGLGYMAESRSLAAYRTLRGMRMAGGSQTTMLTVANHSLANSAETEPHTLHPWKAAA